MTPQININLPEVVPQRFQQAKYFFHEKITSVTDSAQQIGESWKQTATQTTNKAVDTVTTTFGQAKNSLEETLQNAEQFPSSTSSAIQTAINSSVSDWLNEHPAFFRVVQILSWAANHPIISLIILLFVIAIIWSIIKAIVHLIETASLSILQAPLILLLGIIKVGFLSATKVGNFAVQQITAKKKTDTLPVLPPASSQPLLKDKQQRLAEISTRLAEIQNEQHELIKEAAELMASDTIDVKIQG